MTVKAGLVGCGRIGYKFDLDPKRTGTWTHAGAYHKHDDVEFVGVYDYDDAVAAECAEKYGVKAYLGGSEALNKLVEDVDLLSIAVPEDALVGVLTHLEHLFSYSKSYPKILWVEKPFIGRYDEADRFVKEFAKYNCHIHINYQRRFCEAFEELKTETGVRHIDVTYVRGLLNTASHFIDMMIGLYGKPYSVITTKVNSNFIMRYDGFDITFTMLEDIKYNVCDVKIYTDHGIIEVPPIQTYIKRIPAVPSEQYSEYLDLGEPEIVKITYDPMLDQVTMLVEAIKTNRYLKLNDGLATLEVLYRIDRTINK